MRFFRAEPLSPGALASGFNTLESNWFIVNSGVRAVPGMGFCPTGLLLREAQPLGRPS